jgi:hypothetical protein
VLQRLLREGLPIRDLVSILEALSDAAEQTKDPEALTEHVRRTLSTVIVQMLGGGEAPIRAITVGPRLEVALMQLFSPRAREGQRTLDPEELTLALHSLNRIVEAQGAWLGLRWFIGFLELISTFILRPFTLAVRLFANMVSGHLLLTVLLGSGVVFISRLNMSSITGVLWLAFGLLIYPFEIFVASLQAYVFTLLAAVYIQTSVHIEH